MIPSNKHELEQNMRYSVFMLYLGRHHIFRSLRNMFGSITGFLTLISMFFQKVFEFIGLDIKMVIIGYALGTLFALTILSTFISHYYFDKAMKSQGNI